MTIRNTRTARAIAAITLAAAVASPLTSAPASATTTVTCPGQPSPVSAAQVDRAWTIAAARLSALAGPRTLPFGATGTSRYLRTGPTAWTSGFYPASLWLAYQRTMDPAWLDRARAYTSLVLPMARWTGTHDLGFMVGLPTGLARDLDPDPTRAARYADARLTAARTLSTRWNGRVGALLSARYDGRWGVIIDSAMNAPLLIEEGTRIGGVDGRRLVRRGTTHLRTLARDFVRPDGSTFHRQSYDPRTGRLLGPIAGQGLSTGSTWARGQAWAVNGFAQGVRLTGDLVLLDAARRTADLWMSRVPAGCVPAWDLDVTRASAPLDSSAAAILAD
ncbi:MAG: hypothetical protein ACKO04_09895, partial [Actinomycetes bacterium]